MASERKRRRGDRRDGRRLRSLDPLYELTPYIMKVKSESSNYFSDSIDISGIESYLRGLRRQGYPGLGILHLFVAGYLRVVSQYPGLNRFISGQRIFARNNIEFIMMIKKEMKTTAGETSIKVVFTVDDTIFDVYKKINAEVEKIKNEGEVTDTDDVAKTLMKLPRFLLRFAVYVLTKMDYFGKLPKSIEKASPFHGSVMITDLGSISMPAVYHHLYDFGNIPMFIAIGTKRRAFEIEPDGVVSQHKYIDYRLTIDERICDGFYFSQAMKMFRRIIRQPEMLETSPTSVVEDVD